MYEGNELRSCDKLELSIDHDKQALSCHKTRLVEKLKMWIAITAPPNGPNYG